MNIKSGSIQGFEQYSQFSSLKEFNTHIEMWLVEHRQEFTKGERVGWKRLVRFAAKFPGVCNAKIGTILKAINEEYNDNGISRSTFKRMVLKAKALGILTVHETERKNGSQSSNLYIFNRFPQNEPPKAETLTHLNKTSNPLETNYQKNKERREEEASSASTNISAFEKTTLDHTYTSNRVPQEFVQLVKCFFPEAKTIEEYWHMAITAAYKFNFHHEKDLLMVSILAFKQLISQLKSSSKVRKPIAFFYGIITNLFTDRIENQYETKLVCPIMKNGEIVFYDWLNL